MLSNVECGWCDVTIGNFEDQASYLTDVPMQCLQSAIYALRDGLDFCVTFDTEGRGDFSVIAGFYCTTIVREDELSVVNWNYDKLTLAKEIHDDISSQINKWVDWNLDYEVDFREAFERRKRKLLEKLDELDAEIRFCELE